MDYNESVNYDTINTDANEYDQDGKEFKTISTYDDFNERQIHSTFWLITRGLI